MAIFPKILSVCCDTSQRRCNFVHAWYSYQVPCIVHACKITRGSMPNFSKADKNLSFPPTLPNQGDILSSSPSQNYPLFQADNACFQTKLLPTNFFNEKNEFLICVFPQAKF